MHGFVLGRYRKLIEQSGQMALCILETLQLHGEVGALSLELQVCGVISEGLLVNEEDSLKPVAGRILLIHQPRVPRPGGPIVAVDTQELAQRLLRFLQLLAGLGAASTVEQRRGVPPDLGLVDDVDPTAEHRCNRKQDSQKGEIKLSHRSSHGSVRKVEARAPPAANLDRGNETHRLHNINFIFS